MFTILLISACLVLLCHVECTVLNFIGEVTESGKSIEHYYNSVNREYISHHEQAFKKFDIPPTSAYGNTVMCNQAMMMCDAVKFYKEKSFHTVEENSTMLDSILITTSVIHTSSFGNMFSNYIETLSCAQLSQVHYASVCRAQYDHDILFPGKPVPVFLQYLPFYLEYDYNKSSGEQMQARTAWFEEVYKNDFRVNVTEVVHKQHDLPSNPSPLTTALLMKQYCSLCTTSPHGVDNPAWIHNIPNIRGIINYALAKHILLEGINIHLHEDKNAVVPMDSNSVTIVMENDLSNRQVGSVLPLIPDVTIHYRCGDIFSNGAMGFLKTSTIVNTINSDSSVNQSNIGTIYVLGEHVSRHRNPDRQHKCDVLYAGVFNKLKSIYPSAAIVVKRGSNMVSDMIRMTYSNVTVCSTSTFCLWFAIASPRRAYFPYSLLVLYRANKQDTLNIDIHAKWIENPELITGQSAEHMSAEQLTHSLNQ